MRPRRSLAPVLLSLSLLCLRRLRLFSSEVIAASQASSSTLVSLSLSPLSLLFVFVSLLSESPAAALNTQAKIACARQKQPGFLFHEHVGIIQHQHLGNPIKHQEH